MQETSSNGEAVMGGGEHTTMAVPRQSWDAISGCCNRERERERQAGPDDG